MEILNVIWIIFQVLVGYHLVLPLLLLLIWLLVKRRKDDTTVLPENDYAIIVTAYQQTTLVPDVVKSIQKLNYANYLVYIVADNCDDISNLDFNDEKIIVLKPETVLSSNTKSHFYAIHHFRRAHQYLTIIDSDNLVTPNYLTELDKVFARGFVAIQGVRAAKNLNSTYACLDAASDIYYRFIDRELLFNAGSSAALSGSGMAFTVQLYRDCLEHLVIDGAGFDKVFQLEIQRRNLRVAFAENAVVFDEKTSKADQLVKQRARWINTWFKYAGQGYGLVISGIKNFSWNQFIYGLFFTRPPLFILVFLSFFCFVVDLFISPAWAIAWVCGAISFVFCFFVSLAYFRTPRVIYNALFNVPVFMFYQVISLFKSKQANKISVATEHYHASDAATPSEEIK